MARVGFSQLSLHVGLELSPRSVKVAWCRGGRLSKPTWQFIERPRGSDTSPEALRDLLNACLQPIRRRRFSSTLILCAPTSYVRTITVQVSDLKQIPEAVKEQLPKVLPFAAEGTQVKFTPRRRQRTNGEWECLLSVAACEVAPLTANLDGLWQAGWGTNGVVPSALALAECAKALDAVKEDYVLLVDIGQGRTTMALVERGEVVYARDVTIGNDHLVEALMGQVSVGERTVSLTWEQAEAITRAVGIPADTSAGAVAGEGIIPTPLPMDTYLAMIQPILEQLVSELRRTMTSATQASPAASATRVLLSGEGSRLPQCDQWLSKQLGVSVELLNCERFLGQAGRTAAIVCGLALHEGRSPLDLQPAPSRQRWLIARTAAMLWRVLALGVVAIWLGAGWVWLQHGAVAVELSRLTARWTELQPVVVLQEDTQAHLQLVRRLSTDRSVAVEWFRSLARDFPGPVRLTRLSVESTREVEMYGEAQGRDQTPEAYVSELTLWLEESGVCPEVELDATQRLNVMDVDEELVRFTLKCRSPGVSP